MPRIQNPSRLTHPKIKGEVIAKIHGLTLYAELKLPKRSGKARVQIQIRQEAGHDWHVEQCLNYSRSLDILFATDTTRNNKGQIA